jgi:hypothetical protein
MLMSDPTQDDKPAKPEPPKASREITRPEDVDEEEKILAGRPDVNMPALLTKDVRGG